MIGAGQAGLATSHELSGRGVEHVVLERDRVAQRWRNRWDSFCLVTPNWTVQLPGGAYEGPDPDGFLPRDDIVAHLEAYAAGMPVRERTDVVTLRREREDFVLETSGGDLRARRVVLATGAYQRPYRPPAMDSLPSGLPQIDVDGYRRETDLPRGRVLIVGSGQSGCQLAEELHEAGREVILSCGRAPWVPRRIGAKDMVWWAVRSGFMDQRLEAMPNAGTRLWSNPLASGHDGGHDLHLRTLRALGVTLVGRFMGADGGAARFAADLGDTVAWGDDRYRQFRQLVQGYAAGAGLEIPELADPGPFDARAPERVELAGIGVVILAGGFRPDYRAWLPWPEAFDEVGFPRHTAGASTVVPGLYFVGVHFLRTRKSSLLLGVGEDASVIAGAIADG